MIFSVVAPVILIMLAIGAFLYPSQAGILFCKVGKTCWRISTLGLTDMHWFYPEEKAQRIGRQLALIFSLIGIPFMIFGVLAHSGPNSFAAMVQAEDYLENTYGSSKAYSVSCDSATDKNAIIVHYEYSGKRGSLLGRWNGQKYIFTEESRGEPRY